MSVIETQAVVDELYATIDIMLDKADEIANLRETLVDLQLKLDKTLCPWSIAPLGYEACYGSGEGNDSWKATKIKGYSYILYKGKPVYHIGNIPSKLGKKSFPKANVEKGIIQKSDGHYYYTGTTCKSYKLDDRYTEYIGKGRKPRQ